jgi:hypothetical protein
MSQTSTLTPLTAGPLVDVEVAVLDEHGVIVAVNDAWSAFSLYNGGDPTACGVGANYLRACERSGDDGSAATVAELIKAAIHGRAMAATSIVIDCHSPSELRWFELFVSPRGDRARRGATVMLLPVPVGAPPAPGAPDECRAPDMRAVHHAVVRRLAVVDRLVHSMAGEPTNEQVDEALRHIDAAIVSQHRAAHEIDARRPGATDHG